MRLPSRIVTAAAAATTVLAGGWAVGLAPASAATATVANNVPWYATSANLTGSANPNGQLTVSVYLADRSASQLAALVRSTYTPGSASFHHFLTPAQFRAGFAPAASDVSAVKSFLSQKGLKVTYAPANGAYVDATGSVEQVSKAFGVTENLYRYAGHTLRGNANAPSVPSDIAGKVLFVGGLDDTELLYQPDNLGGDSPSASPPTVYPTPGPCSHTYAEHTTTVTPSANEYGSTLPWVMCGYTAAQIREIYGLGGVAPATSGPLTGAGVRVGITDAFASPTAMQDLNLFSQQNGLPPVTSSSFQQVVTPGTYNFPENRFDPAGWYGEESLDLEAVHTMAPGATIIYEGGNNSNAPLDHALIDMIDNHRADVITNSWGISGDQKQYGHWAADEQAFMQAALEGISVLFSSGDDGDVAAITGLAQGSWPATSPYVTAVGGTNTLLHADGSKTEAGWGTYGSVLKNGTVSSDGSQVTGSGWSVWPPSYISGSGGGISVNFAQPWYQAGVVPPAEATTTTTASGSTVTFPTPHRVSPDVAMLGDPDTGFLYGETYTKSSTDQYSNCVSLNSQQEFCESRIGGTSVASPMFAGALALVDQARAAAGQGPAGFVNPAVYASGGAGFTDVAPPAAPTAFMRDYLSSSRIVPKLRTVNSTVDSSGNVVEGADTSLRTTAGWDDVTGWGSAWVPNLIAALG